MKKKKNDYNKFSIKKMENILQSYPTSFNVTSLYAHLNLIIKL